MPRRFRLQPYQQGELDALCGVYCVVNAVRLVMQPDDWISRSDSLELFTVLIEDLAKRKQLAVAVTEGAEVKPVARCLRRARKWLRHRYGVELIVERPFRGYPNAWPSPPLTLLHDHLQQPGRAAIVSTAAHWTVAQRTTRSTLRLFDSNGGSALRVRSDETSCEPLLLPTTFLLSVPADA